MIAAMIPFYCVIAISLLTLLVSVGIAWEVRRVDSHVLRLLDGRGLGEPLPELPVYPARTPEDYKEQARAYWEHHVRLEAIKREAAMDAVDHAAVHDPAKRRAVLVTRDSSPGDEADKTPLSPIGEVTLRRLRAEHGDADAAATDEDEAQTWKHKSGTWKREGQ